MPRLMNNNKMRIAGALLLALSLLPATSQAQFLNFGNDLYHNNGDVGIGIQNPNRELHLVEFQTGNSSYPAPIEVNTTGLRIEHNFRNTNFQSFSNYQWDLQVNHRGFSIYDRKLNQFRMFIDNAGEVGIGTSSPAHLLDVNGEARLSGNVGIGGAPTSNDLEVYGYGRIRRNLLVGETNSGLSSRLSVVNSSPNGTELAIRAYANNTGIGNQKAIFAIAEGAIQHNEGIFSAANGNCNGNTSAIGATGQAAGARNNYGLYGRAYTNSCSNFTAGVYGYVNASKSNAFAGYFQGNTFSPGGVWTSSDRKLKHEVKNLDGITAALMELQAKTYTFRTREFAGMNLPEGKQYGFIAQELEKVFPEMTMQIQSPEVKDAEGNIESRSVEFTAVNYQSLIPLLVQGFQEQQGKIEAQDEQIAVLEQRLNDALAQKSSGDDILSGGAPALGNNVPNPFRGSTQIPVFLNPEVRSAKLLVFDMTGQLLRSFPVEARGHGTVQLEAYELAAGMYIYTLFADGKEVDSKRMILEN